ncbi:hypothetical protein LCGC14_2316400 [marine sediment metagenome]|uniref:DUF8033 domain-containing protein n=1 Tax=marine sediment metagenome TaxID=412755 RepID=A0A0F9EWK8_9ZZZZ
MKVSNMISSRGKKVANQFVIHSVSLLIKDAVLGSDGFVGHKTGVMFQSYETYIAFKSYEGQIYLDLNNWNYSQTTSTYRNIFLGETSKETQAKIDSGEYILANLN